MDLGNNILKALEQNLLLPKVVVLPSGNEHSIDPRLQVKLDIVEDASMLNCGCVVSEGLISELKKLQLQGFKALCPTCGDPDLSLVGPITPLRNLYKQLQFYKHLQIGGLDLRSEENTKQIVTEDKPKKQLSLLTLFHEVATRVMNSPTPEEHTDSKYSEDKKCQASTEDINLQSSSTASLGSSSNVLTCSTAEGIFKDAALESKAVVPNHSRGASSTEDEKKELYFVKCFPMYRKRSQYNTHAKLFRAKSRLFNSTYISRNCDRFALISETKWEIYNIIADSKPVLYCCGTVAGEYGPDFKNLKMPADAHEVLHSNWKTDDKSKRPDRVMAMPEWEHLYCRISNNVFVIAGTSGYLRVFNLAAAGKPVFTHSSNFPIRYIELNPEGTLIACSITGKDRSTGAEQALIVLQPIERKDNVLHFPKQVTVTLPYRDPINTMQFSSDGNYLSCSTALESRFFVVSLKNINEPRLVMKSLRLIDTSQPSEGITSANLFPGNPKLMCITSVATNSPPIVVDTRIGALSGMQTVAQPKMLLRLDEVGYKIHGCEISPRGDSIAFLDRNGTVYMMSVPHMLNNQTRRIFVVEIVATASRARESASMRFSRDGDKLFLLDRKGVLYVEDFAYNLPNHHEVTRCKQIL